MPPDHDSATIDLRVRYAETDQMGVVYHANYLVWCEIGRTDLIRKRWASYAELERDGIVLAVADASIRFHASARYDDLIRVETWVEAARSRTVTFGYRIFKVDEETGATSTHLASATTSLISLDRTSRPRALPRDLLERLRPDP